MADTVITIIGAGVVGLATAECLSREYGSVYLIDKYKTFGQEISSRNSEVIHAGIYYPEGSLKARLCVEGKELLYQFCRKWDVPFNNCGKLIVATSREEVSVIDGIIVAASKNGLRDLKILSQEETAELEPGIFAMQAIWSPSTGIVDSHSLMKQLETNFINNGGNVVYGSEVTGLAKNDKGYIVSMIDSDGNNFSFTTEVVINSAGLSSDKVSEMAGIHDPALKINFCKGEYFRLKPPKNKMLRRLVYPVPFHNMEGIGIHVTIDMAGGVKLGPDVTWLDENVYNYSVDASKQEAFFRSVRRFLPFIDYEDLAPEMAGIRPKIQKPGGPQLDFYIKEESVRGCKGFINLVGIESPGLTSCIAIGRYVKSLIRL